MPEWLTEEAAEIWPSLAGRLSDQGRYAPEDDGALGRLCELYAVCAKATRSLAKWKTLTTKTNGGKTLIIRPEVPTLLGASKELRYLENLFGLSPAARAELKIDDDQGSPSAVDRFRRDRA